MTVNLRSVINRQTAPLNELQKVVAWLQTLQQRIRPPFKLQVGTNATSEGGKLFKLDGDFHPR